MFSETGSMKEESLVIVNQHVTVNRNPNLVHPARHAKGICLLDVHTFLYKQFLKNFVFPLATYSIFYKLLQPYTIFYKLLQSSTNSYEIN